MGKYANIQNSVYAIFNSSQWKAEAIKTFPNNFVGKDVGNEYIRVTIIASGSGINRNSVSGILSIDIFIPAGDGPNRASLIADKLDGYLVGKSKLILGGHVQFQGSNLQPLGIDGDNPTLTRYSYSITFNYFGV